MQDFTLADQNWSTKANEIIIKTESMLITLRKDELRT